MSHHPSVICSRRPAFLLLILFLLLPPLLSAQQATSKIVGTVTDASGAVMPGVNITVKQVDTGITYNTKSNDLGYFEVLNLPIGSYEVSAKQEGFQTLVSNTPPLQINQVLRLNLQMKIGARREALTVEAGVAAVETVNPTLGNSVTSRPVIDMPLNGRNVLDLALLQPGVTEVNPYATEDHQAGGFGIAGGKSDSVTYLLDGGMNNALLNNGVVFNPSPDTVAEFRILTSNYSAEYGRNASGIISVVTKSGTNALHGSVYDFLRNDAFNANSFFNKQAGLPREVLKRNQFGFTLGGPVVIPHVVDGRNKFFWFASYQGQRQTQVQTTGALPVFTPLEIQGDFSRSGPGGTPDPLVAGFLQAHPYWQSNPGLAAQAIIDPARINSTAQKYIAAGLVPVSGGADVFTKKVQGLGKSDSDMFTAKVDAEVSAKDRLSLTLGGGRNPNLNPFSFVFGGVADDAWGYSSTGNTHPYFFNLAWNRTFASTLLNEARFTGQRMNYAMAFPAKKLPVASDLGIGVTPDESTGPPRIGFYRGLSLGFSPQGPTTEIDNTFTWMDTLSWVKGKHSMKYGAVFSAYQNNTHYDYYVNGEFDFYGSTLYDGSTCAGAGSCNDFADFLFGLPDEYWQFGAAPSNIRSRSYYAFAQDEWHVARNLSFTFGLRYEYNSPKFDTQGRSFSLGYGRQSTRFVNAPPGLLFPFDPGAPRGANFPDRNNFAPRFGFAWDPFGTGKTSLRGGFGVFYDILKGEDNLQFNGQAPFFGYTDLYYPALAANPSGDPGYFSQPFVVNDAVNPFPSKPPAPDINFMDAGFLPFGGGGVYFVNPHMRTPYTYQYNLSLQHELADRLIMELSYVGNTTHKQTGLVDWNPFLLGTSVRRFNTQPGIDPSGDNGFSYLDSFANVVAGRYDSLQASLTKQLTRTGPLGNTYFSLSYTWGKSFDNASGFRNVNSQVPTYNPGLFRSVADYDITHRIAFSGGWDVPLDEAWASGPKRLTKGWSLYPIVTYRTGFPLDIFAGLPFTRTDPGPSGAGDAGLVRVNMTGATPYYDPRTLQTFNVQGSPTTGSFWFNPEMFNANYDPAVYTYGTYGRNSLRGPGRTNFDFAIAKKTPIAGERLNAEFRAEFFNILNHAQFELPNLTYTDPGFGQITSTADPRIIQLALRFTF